MIQSNGDNHAMHFHQLRLVDLLSQALDIVDGRTEQTDNASEFFGRYQNPEPKQ
jgi:hypothetical protein